MITPLVAFALSSGLTSLIYIFVAVLVLCGVVWLIERYLSPIPNVVKVVLAVVALLAIVIWFLRQMGI